MKLTIRQLEIFLSIVQSGTVSSAAKALCLSQSAASSALAELERQFDVRLFDRAGKRLRLNDVGQAMLPRAAEMLDRAKELESSLRKQDARGELRVGATLTISHYLATLIACEYMQNHSGSKVTLHVDNTSRVVAKVANFELDLGLVEGSCQHPDIDVIHWGNDVLQVFSAPDHPLATKRKITPADLAAVDWIVREPGSGTRATFERAVATTLPTVRIKLELAHTEAIKRAVASGLGIGCISRLALIPSFRRGNLVALKTPFLKLSREFLILIHKQKYRTAACRDFIDLCHEHIANRSGKSSP